MMKRKRLAVIGIMMIVALGLSLLAAGLNDFARWGGYMPLLQIGPLLLLFVVGSLALPRRSR